MALQSAESPPWSDLPPELLGRIATCFRKPVDRASFRAVCRSWRLAVRHHCPRTPLTPWALHHDGSFFTLPDGHHRNLPTTAIRRYEPASYGFYNNPSRFSRARHRLPLPKHTRCIGSSNGWLALLRLHHGPESSEHGTFLLHDPFSNTTVRLSEVNAVSAKAPCPDALDVFKVLMRSTIDDIVAVMTLSRHCSFILSLPGKSA
ncbi:hypothetical protein QOZ80_5AG0365330 [Eleusine coracana subsp. coracana]|nr:hypothetical protein QOZ80_5AG0365330 [Eleusine coracana subsp. coracana]